MADYEPYPEHEPRGRLEPLIKLAAPALDLILFAGDRLSRFAGRNEIPAAPPRRTITERRSPLGGKPD